MENSKKKNKIDICLIGLGNIGFRHLQSLLKIKYLNRLDIIDISFKDDFLKKIKKLNKYSVNINYERNYNSLLTKYDFLIISTNSDVRFKSLINFLKNSFATNIILEKILFNKRNHYINLNTLIKKYNLSIWINCPRRTYKIYKLIRKKFISKFPFEMNITGNYWNLASNSIHYIDLFSFYTHSINFQYNLNGLHKKIYKSKRNDFIELKGEIKLKDSYNNRLTLTDNRAYKKFIMEIKINNKLIKIEETSENIILLNNDLGIFKKSYQLEKQSNLTKKYIDDIIRYGKCDLPNVCENLKTHFDFFKSLNSFIKNINSKKNLNVT